MKRGTLLNRVTQQVSKEKKGKIVDARCRDLTSAFACEKGRADPGSVELCSFHEVSDLSEDAVLH